MRTIEQLRAATDDQLQAHLSVYEELAVSCHRMLDCTGGSENWDGCTGDALQRMEHALESERKAADMPAGPGPEQRANPFTYRDYLVSRHLDDLRRTLTGQGERLTPQTRDAIVLLERLQLLVNSRGYEGKVNYVLDEEYPEFLRRQAD